MKIPKHISLYPGAATLGSPQKHISRFGSVNGAPPRLAGKGSKLGRARPKGYPPRKNRYAQECLWGTCEAATRLTLSMAMRKKGTDGLKVATTNIFGLYVRAKFQGISPEKYGLKLWYLHFRILKVPWISLRGGCGLPDVSCHLSKLASFFPQISTDQCPSGLSWWV